MRRRDGVYGLVVGTLLLAWRAVRPANRFVVAPIALGVAVGIFPLALLDALPQALGRPPIMWARSTTCMQPRVKGYVNMVNSFYNGFRFEDVWLDK